MDGQPTRWVVLLFALWWKYEDLQADCDCVGMKTNLRIAIAIILTGLTYDRSGASKRSMTKDIT